MRKKVLAIIIAVIVAVSGSSVAGIVFTNSSKYVFIRSILDVAEELTEREELNLVFDALDGGSFQLDYNNSKDIDIQGKAYFGKKKFLLDDFYYKTKGKQIDGSLYLSKKELCVESQSLLKGRYGGKWSSLAEDFEDSIFAYGSSSVYSIKSKQRYEEIYNALEDCNFGKIGKDIKNLITYYFAHGYIIFMKNAEFEKDIQKITFFEGSKKCRVIKVSLDKNALAKTIDELYTFLLKDNKLYQFVDKYEGGIKLALNLAGYDVLNEQKLSTTLYNLLAEKQKQVKEYCDRLYNGEILEKVQFTLVTPRGKSQTLAFSVDIDGEREFALDCGKNGIKKTRQIKLDTSKTHIVYNLDKTNSGISQASLIKDNNPIFVSKINPNSQTFELTINQETLVKGQVIRQKNIATIKVNSVYSIYNGQISEQKDIYFYAVIKTKDKIPKIEGYKTLSQITNKDVNNIIFGK